MQRNRIERTASKRWRGSVRRILSAAIYNLSCFTHGCSTGWVSGVLGREALAGGAWLAALPCLVALPTAPFFAFLADAHGRRAGAGGVAVTFIVSWSLAAWCGPRGVWAARVVAGAGGAGALALAPLYCAEISPRTKGLAAMPALAISCGILFAFVAGGILSAHALALSMVAPPTVLLLSLVWLPETPSFLISVGRMQDAARVICWLDGSDFREDLTDAIEQQEVIIRTEPGRRESEALQPMLRRSRSEGTSEGKEQSVCWDLFRHRRSRRALISCCVLLAAAAGSGAGAATSFAAAVLAHSGHALPALNLTAYNFTVYNGTVSRGWRQTSETGSVLCGTALVLGAAVATVTVDKVGRKVLLLISCVGIAFCLALLGFYCDPRAHMYSWYPHRLWPYRKTIPKEKHVNYTIENTNALTNITDKPFYSNESIGEIKLQTEKEVNASIEETSSVKIDPNLMGNEDSIWPTVILLSMVLFLYNVGLGSVPYVLISELFSINVRSLASSLLISWMWLSSFFTLRYFGSLATSLGLHGTFYIGACSTLLVSVFIHLMLPETRGLNQKQIDDLLNGPLFVHKKRKRKNET
ncbi:solute carrier family 2, facilitated glucose transporter member 8-like [Leguminivora glycinivorella]|uniref:solute carrier family 2, facilitated glucose transporter member 8-like n=1 Tax=Leguminivora glycinivorella TaxID=1035111 RepID=UPI00200CEAF6|nr:solute carrier family 2, facilitated glucose transporter member 8-like [Leguminivora glycinivorella]